jgi:hypothetical protein
MVSNWRLVRESSTGNVPTHGEFRQVRLRGEHGAGRGAVYGKNSVAEAVLRRKAGDVFGNAEAHA